MKKELKDYLHLYLGCQIDYFDYISNQRFVGELQGIADENYAFVKWDQHGVPFNDIKLLLRPLSDMTEEEISHLFFLDGGSDGDFIRGEAKDGHYIQVEYSHQGEKLSFLYSIGKLPVIFIPYLLKQSFDLFDLIPEGLAIDKTTMTKK